jgi:hypothetical protein
VRHGGNNRLIAAGREHGYHGPMLMLQWILVLLLAVVILTNLAERLAVPYPSLLAIAGAGLAFLPFAPQIRIEPELALALFVPPALLDAAFDTSPRGLRDNVIPVASMAVVAVVLTTAAIAFLGWRFAGLSKARRLHRRFWTPAESVETSALWVDSESSNNLPIFSGMSERVLSAEPTVTVECLSCRHVGVLTGATLSRFAIMPDTPIATFVKRLRCSRCGSRSVLATRKPPARSQRAS